MRTRSPRTKTLRNIATVSALAIGIPLLSVPGATAADAAPVSLTTTFNDPTGTTAQQNAIRDHLVSLIDRAEPGSVINGSIYLFNDDPAGDALVRAHQRGVKVKMIVDGQNTVGDPAKTGSEYPKLAAALGTDTSGESFILACPATRGCIGNRKLSTGRAINHNKYFLFSKTGGTENVVFQTSANLTKTQRVTYFNNAVTIPDDGSGLYANYLGYWKDQLDKGSRGSGQADYYTSQKSGPYKTYRFPRRETNGTTPTTDPKTDTIFSALNNVDCAGGRTQIRVAMYIFTRAHVAEKMADLKKAGCQVELVQSDEAKVFGKTVQSAVTGKLSSLTRCMATAQNPGEKPRPITIHSKYLLIEGTYRGVKNSKLVFTGSHNFSYPSLRAHDETLLKIDNAAVYDQFKSNFNTIKNNPYCAA